MICEYQECQGISSYRHLRMYEFLDNARFRYVGIDGGEMVSGKGAKGHITIYVPERNYTPDRRIDRDA